MTKYVPGMLTCKEVDDFLHDFTEGSLSYKDKLTFKLHLVLCPECNAYVREYKNTIRLAKAELTQKKSLDNVPEKLMEAILKSRTQE